MAARRVLIAIAVLGALAAAPASAEAQRRRERADRGDQQRVERTDRQRARGRDSVVRTPDIQQRANRDRPREVQRQNEVQRQRQVQRAADARRQAEVQRRSNARRVYPRPYNSSRGYGSRTVIVPRVVRPRIVTVVPYRPYVYRPRLSLGLYYGSSGAYPYGYTPRGYYDPIPGRLYGGLRITDAPREAHVFADGYYVGIVNDFDGVFQHLNLEAGPHHIEIRLPGYDDDAVGFDVAIQPGRTITYRADWY